MDIKPKHPYHPVVRINYVPRIIGGLFMFAIMASVLYNRDNNPPYIWPFVGFCLIWPHLAFQISKMSRRSKQTEIRNMYVDAFFFGFFIPVSYFNVWVAVTFTNQLISNFIRIGGFRLLGIGFIFYVIGILAALKFSGIHFVPEGNAFTIGLCVFLLTIYFSSFSVMAYNMTRQLVHSKRSLENANEQIKKESEERKRAMEAKLELEAQILKIRKLEAIGTLTSGITHHFNNILTIIIGNTELALDEVSESESVHLSLKEIHIASLRARNIVSQLQYFTRNADPERKPVQLTPIVQDTMTLIKEMIPPGIDFRYDFHDTDDLILANISQIHQLIVNLCTNAADAMKDQGGTIAVTIENIELDDSTDIDRDLVPGPHIKLTISDTGKGIAHDIIDRVFDPFFTTKEIGKEGSGMGLSVVYGIVKSHDGAISVDSEPGKGTAFSMFFPVIKKHYNII